MKGMHVLDMKKDSLALETTGFGLQPILEHDVRHWVFLVRKVKNGAFWGISVGGVRLDRWRVVSARIGPRLQGMHVLDLEKDALASETTGLDLKPTQHPETTGSPYPLKSTILHSSD